MNEAFLIDSAKRTWLRRMSFDQVVELWWDAQRMGADALETHTKRMNDPNDMYGKSAAYANAFYAQKESNTNE